MCLAFLRCEHVKQYIGDRRRDKYSERKINCITFSDDTVILAKDIKTFRKLIIKQIERIKESEMNMDITKSYGNY